MNATRRPRRAVLVAALLSGSCLLQSAAGPLPAEGDTPASLDRPEEMAVGESLSWLPGEAIRILGLLARNHPRIAAVASDYAAARADALSLRGFYQPRASVGGGISQGPVSAPDSTLSSYLREDAASLQGGLLLPIRSGAYVGLGLAQRRLDSALEDEGSCGQTLAGARLEIPLLRDRGFAIQQAKEETADADAERMVHLCAGELQSLGHDAVLAFATELYATATLRSNGDALDRVKALLAETSERVKLETTPQYQVFSAEMEVAFRRDDVRRAEAVLTNAHHRLELLAGGLSLPPAARSGATLRGWAERCLVCDVAAIVEAHGSERPEVAAARQALAGAMAEERAARQGTRSSLTLTAGVGYQGEDAGGGLGTDNLLRDDRVGGDVALVWSRPLSFDAEEAAERASRARSTSARERLRDLLIVEQTRRLEAMTSLAAARERLTLVDEAIEAAGQALASETERLRLGEGRSRNVLDAQNDLTAAIDRANLAAYDLVCAFTDVMVAHGVPLYPRIQIGDGNGTFRTLD